MSDNWPSEQKLTVWSDDSKGTLLFEGDLANEDGTQVPLVWTMTGVNSITAGMYFKLEDQYDDGMLDPDGQAVQFAILDASDVEQFQATLAVGSDELDYLDENDLNSDYLEMKVNASADGFEYIQVPSAPPAVVRTRIHHDQLRMPSHDEYDAELAGEFATPALAVAGGATPGSLSVDGLPLEYIGIGLGLSAYGARGFGVGEMIVNKGKLDEDITEMEGLISDELTRALAAEAGIQAALDAQEAKEAAYEVSNDAAVGVERSRIDTLLSGSDVDLDQLVELVAAYELADTSIISSITNLQLSTDAAMATEQAARAAGDAAERAFALAARDANEAARTSEIAAAKVVHDQEIVDAKVVADAAMATEQAARAAGDAGLQAALDAQEAKEAAYEVSNDAALAAEIARAIGSESDLDDAISAEGVRALAAESVLQGNIDVVVGDLASYESANDAAVLVERLRIDDILSNVDPAALDSLTEIVTEMQSISGSLSDSIISALGTHTSELSAHEAVYDAKMLLLDAEDASIRVAFAAGDAAERAFALAARNALQADVDANELDGDTDRALIRTEMAAFEAARDASVEVIRAALQADVDGNESDGDTDRALIRTEMATNESNRDASIAADKATHDAEIAAAKVVADAEMVTEQAARTAGDAAERAFALAARDANESARDASIAADKATHDAEIAAAKVLADAEITNIKADLVSLGGMFQGFTFLPMQMDISAGTQIDFTDPAGLNMPPMSMFTYITLNGMIMNQNTDYTVDYDGSGDIKGFTVNVDLFTGDVVSFFGTKSFDLQS